MFNLKQIIASIKLSLVKKLLQVLLTKCLPHQKPKVKKSTKAVGLSTKCYPLITMDDLSKEIRIKMKTSNSDDNFSTISRYTLSK